MNGLIGIGVGIVVVLGALALALQTDPFGDRPWAFYAWVIALAPWAIAALFLLEMAGVIR